MPDMVAMKNVNPTQAPTGSTIDRAQRADLLPVEGALPVGLDGTVLLASPHPLHRGPAGDGHTGPQLYSGIRLAGGLAWRYRATLTARRDRPLGPLPSLAPTVWPGATADEPGPVAIAHPVRDEAGGLWHTIATYPGVPYAEHLVAAHDGTILRADRLPLQDAPLVQAVALTRRYVIVLDLPLTYCRAAALVGMRFPYAWRPDRPARVGLLPRHTLGATPHWFPIDSCYVEQVVNAYEDGHRVVIDAIRHDRAPDPMSTQTRKPARVCRWTVDPQSSAVDVRPLSGPMDVAIVDGRVRDRSSRWLFGCRAEGPNGAEVVCDDLSTGRTALRVLGAGRRAGPPVFVPRTKTSGTEGDGWLLMFVEDTRTARSALLVLDALDITGPARGIVHLPVAMPWPHRAAWLGSATGARKERPRT